MKRFLIWLHTAGLFIACLSVPFAVLIALRYRPEPLSHVSVTNAELVSVILTGLTIVLGVVAVVIAGLAIWGYHAIRDEAKDIAGRVARTETRKRVVEYLKSPTGVEIVENEVAKRFEELKQGLDIGKSYDKSEIPSSTMVDEARVRVGKPYRRKGGPNDGNAGA